MNAGYRKRIVVLLFILLLVRFWFCQTFELTGPEAYTWMKGHLLDWGYWDQGPLVPWLSWLGTKLYHQSELGVRWATANIYVAVGFALFYLGRSWFSPRIGFYAVLLYLVLPIYSWQLLLLSEATLSVGLMALALVVFRNLLLEESWVNWLLGAGVVAVAMTVDWWNLLWAVGFLLFYLLDPRRVGRFISPRSLTFFLVALAGILPFLSYQWLVSGLAPVALHSWPMLAAHQYLPTDHPVSGFFREQLIWSGPLVLLALLSLVMTRRLGVPFLREHLFLICLPLPGLAIQFVLGLFGKGDQDVLAALWLPWLLVMAVIAARLLDLGFRWRLAVRAVFAAALFITLSGFWPSAAARWGARFTPQSQHRLGNLAAEVARAQTETGASFLLTDTPQDASLLSFYLPLHPFVYVAPQQGIHNQYDLWSNYYDNQGSSAIFLSRSLLIPPNEVVREFAAVKSLRDISLVKNWTWRLFTCEGYGAASENSGK